MPDASRRWRRAESFLVRANGLTALVLFAMDEFSAQFYGQASVGAASDSVDASARPIPRFKKSDLHSRL